MLVGKPRQQGLRNFISLILYEAVHSSPTSETRGYESFIRLELRVPSHDINYICIIMDRSPRRATLTRQALRSLYLNQASLSRLVMRGREYKQQLQHASVTWPLDGVGAMERSFKNPQNFAVSKIQSA